MIDSYDRRITQTYMDEYLGDFVFDEYQAFSFYADSNFDYKIPETLKIKDEFLCEFISFVTSSSSFIHTLRVSLIW